MYQELNQAVYKLNSLIGCPYWFQGIKVAQNPTFLKIVVNTKKISMSDLCRVPTEMDGFKVRIFFKNRHPF